MPDTRHGFGEMDFPGIGSGGLFGSVVFMSLVAELRIHDDPTFGWNLLQGQLASEP